MKNRLDNILESKKDLLSIYVMAGYPQRNDLMTILRGLEKAGVDFVEVGMPFSDPLADGPVIQDAGNVALDNGMSIKELFAQIKEMRKEITMPVLLMGYINPVMHYGIEKFAADAHSVGVDGLIIPDLPFDTYVKKYKALFDENSLHFIPLIAPQTPDERIKHIDAQAEGFIYTVASAGITGNIKTSEDYRTQYFERIRNLHLRNKTVIGFGIKDHASYTHACSHADGAIIGTAFIKHLKENGASEEAVGKFVKSIR